jgi:hypothetical protein
MSPCLSLLLLANLARGPSPCETSMSRLKFALGMVLIAGAAIVVAITILNPNAPSRRMNEPDRTAIERGRTAARVADREKKTTARASESGSLLEDFVKSPGQIDPNEANAPRMQQKQIKMH